MRSPKMDDVKFNETVFTPRWPKLSISALGVLYDFKNTIDTLRDILAYVGVLGDSPQAVADRLGSQNCTLTRFRDKYPNLECGDLADRQDPEDIAALDAVVDAFNELVAARAVTREALEPLIAQVNAVYAKYPVD